MRTDNPREAVFLALLAYEKHEVFIETSLAKWIEISHPSVKNRHFAQELAFGTERRQKTLHYLAVQLSGRESLKLKPKERALLYSALYQRFFMDKVPLYALVHETVQLGKKHCHHSFVAFLNAILRKLENFIPKLPQDNDVQALSIRYSYPDFFIESLLHDYGLTKTLSILNVGNQAGATFVRLRHQAANSSFGLFSAEKGASDLHLVKGGPLPIAELKDTSRLASIAASPYYYIQNITPTILIEKLLPSLFLPPQRILDLCASPGGKLIALHDLFPKASLFGNDVSATKLSLLQQNLDKYHIQAHLSCSLGEEFSCDKKFDLIIIDAPCSNSGVLNKRPEARWRLSNIHMKQLEVQQKRLLAHASTLLLPGGCLWYMTCSILKRENEDIVQAICHETGAVASLCHTCLPDNQGGDGGFGCAIRFLS